MFIFWDLSPKWIYSTLQVFYFSILCENGCFAIWLFPCLYVLPPTTIAAKQRCSRSQNTSLWIGSTERMRRGQGTCSMADVSWDMYLSNYSIINSVDWVEHLFLLAFPSCGSLVPAAPFHDWYRGYIPTYGGYHHGSAHKATQLWFIPTILSSSTP